MSAAMLNQPGYSSKITKNLASWFWMREQVPAVVNSSGGWGAILAKKMKLFIYLHTYLLKEASDESYCCLNQAGVVLLLMEKKEEIFRNY